MVLIVNTLKPFTKLLFMLIFNYYTTLVQTDPNWSNFLYDDATRKFNLIDFGAARDFSKHFVDDYLRMVRNDN